MARGFNCLSHVLLQGMEFTCTSIQIPKALDWQHHFQKKIKLNYPRKIFFVNISPELNNSQESNSPNQSAMQRQNAVAAYLLSKQILPFGLAAYVPHILVGR